jgi:MoaA/NifB/PqqE/SkfB family radical SAM enzyme
MSGIDLSKTSFPNVFSLGKVLISGEIRVSNSSSKHGVQVPRFMFFSVTHRCNLSCKGCYAKSWEKGDGLSLSQIVSIINQARGLGTYIFVIAGGEPLMVEGLIQELSQMKDSIFMMFTNGTLIDPKYADELVKAGNIMPVISLDGPEEMNDLRRGEGTWRRATNAMKLLSSRGCVFGFSTMLTHENYPFLLSRKYLDPMWDLGCSLGFFVDYLPFPEDLNPEFVLSEQDFSVKEELVNRARDDCRPYIVNFPPDEYKMNNGRCMAGKGSVHINPDGWLEPCPYSHFASHNLLETTIIDALKSDFFKALRDELAENKNLSHTCQLFSMRDKMTEIAIQTGAESKDLVSPSYVDVLGDLTTR